MKDKVATKQLNKVQSKNGKSKHKTQQDMIQRHGNQIQETTRQNT